ncbi:MAG: hypothetical protein GQ574_22730 [Crocinitomix sp.]|nr:hypothetical protein [Crocinitomix sp.]
MNSILTVRVFIVSLFIGGFYSCKEHKCECHIPDQLTQIIGTKGNKNDAKTECDEITINVENMGGYCIFYSE